MYVYGVYSYSTHGNGSTLIKMYISKTEAEQYLSELVDNREVVYAVSEIEVY